MDELGTYGSSDQSFDDPFLMWPEGEEFPHQWVCLHEFCSSSYSKAFNHGIPGIRTSVESPKQTKSESLGIKFVGVDPDMIVEVSQDIRPVAIGLERCVGVTDEVLLALRELNLQYLEVETVQTPLLTIGGIAECAADLKCLEISGPRDGFSMDWANLCRLTSLEALDISGSVQEAPDLVKAIEELSNLVRVDLLMEKSQIDSIVAGAEKLHGPRNLWISPVIGRERQLLAALSGASARVIRFGHCSLAEVISGLAVSELCCMTHLKLTECELDRLAIEASPIMRHSRIESLYIHSSDPVAALQPLNLKEKLPALRRLTLNGKLQMHW